MSETGRRCAGVGQRGRRSRRRAWAGVALATLAGAGPLAATASAARPPAGGTTVFVHSATSGELDGGRLTLHSISRRVTWAHHSGRAGVMAIKPMHRLLFKPGTAAAIGTLHVAGHHGADEPVFRLFRPRYNPARQIVSYKAKLLNDKRLPGTPGNAGRAARRFRAASLTIVAPPPQHFTPYQHGCSQDAHGPPEQCVGIRGSGLYPGSTVTLDFGSYKETATADSNGTVNVQNLPCPLPRTVWIQAEDSNQNPIDTPVTYRDCLRPSQPSHDPPRGQP